MKHRNKLHWTRSAVVLALVSLTLCFSVFGQNKSDEPMGEEAAAKLVVELKGIVTRVSPDKEEAKLVIEKWDKRRHLGCKTKSEVIELLFEDVKSVIKDAGTQYQIYSMFSFYKNEKHDDPDDKK